MKFKTQIDFMGERIEGRYSPIEVLEMLDKKIVEMKNHKEGV